MTSRHRPDGREYSTGLASRFGQELRDAIDERLAAEIASFGVRLGVGGKMLAAAKTDSEPQVIRPAEEKSAGIGQTGKVDPDFREQRLHQARLIGTQCFTLASAKKPRFAAGVTRFLGSGRIHAFYLLGEMRLEFLDQIGLFPRKAAILIGLAAKMAIGRGARINRAV